MRIPRLRWQDWSLAAKSAAAVTVPLVLLLVALVFSYRMQHHISAADAEVRRALAIQADIQTLHTLIAEAATGVRGYLLTGRDDFLSPYRHAQQALPDTLASLRRHVRDPVVMASLQRIGELWQRKQQSLEELRTQGRTLPPADLQAHLIGSKGVLDELREEIQTMYARETELVREYSTAARQAFLSNLWVDIVSSVLVLASGLGAFYLLFSGVVRRVQVLVGNAERLSRGEAMESLPNGRDELGLLAERLQNVSVLLAARAAEANSASLAKTRFLSRTSHELRTPLNAILGFAQLLESDLRGSPQAPSVEQILAAGRHLLTLIDEVLDIARIESGDLKLSVEAQGLRELVQEALDLLTPLAEHQGITLQLAPEVGGVAVLADRQRLRQVLINLLSNAVKYPARRRSPCRGADQSRAGLDHDPGYRRRHPGGVAAPAFRTLRASGRGAGRRRGHRAGPRGLAATDAAHGRRHRGAEHPRPGQRVRAAAAPRAPRLGNPGGRPRIVAAGGGSPRLFYAAARAGD